MRRSSAGLPAAPFDDGVHRLLLAPSDKRGELDRWITFRPQAEGVQRFALTSSKAERSVAVDGRWTGSLRPDRRRSDLSGHSGLAGPCSMFELPIHFIVSQKEAIKEQYTAKASMVTRQALPVERATGDPP